MAVTDGKLKIRYTRHQPVTLEPLVADVFGSDGGKIRFTRDTNGKVIGFTLNEGRIRDLKFSRQE